MMKPVTIELAELGPQWTGDYVFVWQPKGYEVPLGPGSSGAIVAWIANQFAVLDQQHQPLAGEAYNESLQRRIKNVPGNCRP